jgi:tetratricopeptide (TPR) repeat protein
MILHPLGLNFAPRLNRSSAVLDDAIAQSPDSPFAYARRGIQLKQWGDYSAAAEDIKKAIALEHPDEASLRFELAECLVGMANPAKETTTAANRQLLKQAVTEYSTAIQQQPGKAEYYLGRAKALYHVDSDKAMSDLNEAIRLAPDLLEAYHWRIKLHTRNGRQALARSDQQVLNRLIGE